MGKRKSSRKPMGPKKADPLPTVFTCLFCNHENAVVVKLDKKGGVGNLNCRICGQTFQCAINYLSAAVDVYGEWVDAAESVAKEDAATRSYTGTARTTASQGAARGGAAAASGDYDDDDDDRQYTGQGIVPDDEI